MQEQNKTLLLVEDEAVIALAEVMQLKKAGYAVIHVETGEAAVETVDRDPAAIDLILMDIDLGAGIDGTEAAEQILSRHDLPLVFLSSHAEAEYVERTDRITSYGYVLKNSGEMVLLRSITMAFRLHDANQRLKAGNERLAASERRYHQLFENLTAGFALHQMVYDDQGRAVDYRFLDVNPAFERLTGLTADKVRGRTVREVLPGTEQYWIDAYQEVVRSGEALAYENYSAELERHYEVWAFRHDPGQFAVVIRDVTDRVNATEALRVKSDELRERLRELECLYRVLNVCNDPVAPFPEVLQRIVREIPSGFRRPERVEAEIILGDSRYRSTGFRVREADRPETLLRSIVVENSRLGSVTVAFADPGDQQEHGFLPEEGGLLDAIADEIARTVHAARIAEQLQYEREYLETTLDSIGDAVLVTDESARVVRMNPVAQALTGWSAEDARSRPVQEIFNIVNAHTRKPAPDPVERVLATGCVVGLANDTALVARDGREYQVADSAAPIRDRTGTVHGVILVFRDVTEEYRIRRDLEENEERLNLALRNTNAGVWDWDIDRDIVSHTREWTAMLGYDASEMASSFEGWRNLWHPDDEEAIKRAIDDYLEGRTDRYEVVHRLRHKDGSWRWVLTRGSAYRDDRGKPCRWIGTNVDVTDQKQMEEDLRRAVERNETLLRELQHRVKNNLAIVTGLLSIAEFDVSDPRAREVLSDAQRRVHTIKRIYEKLYQRGEVERTDLKPYLQDLVDSIQESMADVDDVRIRLDTDLESVVTGIQTTVSVGLVANELITNAYKHAFSAAEITHGTIRVELRRVREGNLRLVVADDGAGIPGTTSDLPGEGIGHQLIKALVDQLEGSLQVTKSLSSPQPDSDHAGTTVVVEFPFEESFAD